MAPPNDRDIQLKVLVNKREKTLLEDLAQAEGLTVSDYVRVSALRAHEKKFKSEQPGEAPATVRGILTDMVGPPHYTAGNIASRTRLPLQKVVEVFRALEAKGIVERVDGQGQHSTWASIRFDRDLDKVFAAARKVFPDLDEDLRE
jgi:predicted Rossmann fold nucleotide-binding protein DprA/Smf involved in DNA uptake